MPTKDEETKSLERMLEFFKPPTKNKDGKMVYSGVALGMHLPLRPKPEDYFPFANKIRKKDK